MPMVAGSSPVFFEDFYSMLKFNLKSLLALVDSHIIDYRASITREKKIVISVGFVSLILLFISPIYVIFWLALPTVYFLYREEYKSIFSSWLFFFVSWYLIFTACMVGFDGPIMIKSDFEGCGVKSDETNRIFFYVVDRYFNTEIPVGLWNTCLGGLCIQTLVLMSLLSAKVGFPIYIPSVFKGLIWVFKRLLVRDVEGSGYEDIPSPGGPFSPPSQGPNAGPFNKGGGAPVDPVTPDPVTPNSVHKSAFGGCDRIKSELNRYEKILPFGLKMREVDGKTNIYCKLYIPTKGLFEGCTVIPGSFIDKVKKK